MFLIAAVSCIKSQGGVIPDPQPDIIDAFAFYIGKDIGNRVIVFIIEYPTVTSTASNEDRSIPLMNSVWVVWAAFARIGKLPVMRNTANANNTAVARSFLTL